MIISASRRTDIPAFYGSWFMDKLDQGFVRVKNPMNSAQISQISLLPHDVDSIVFWTKNPHSLLPYIQNINQRGFDCIFQFTLTPYGKDIEPGVGHKKRVIEQFKQLSDFLGAERILWRYDPILFTQTLTPSWHGEQFAYLCRELSGYTHRCTISFLDYYKKIEKDMDKIKPILPEEDELLNFASKLSQTAKMGSIEIVSCATNIDLSQVGISHGSCIDGPLIERLTGKRITRAKDRGQRSHCKCVKSRDIGSYGTCGYGCLYCYAR